jgi:hypothetical protein
VYISNHFPHWDTLDQLKTIGQFLKRWWMAFAHALGWVNTRVILTIFYLVIIGIPAIVLKLIRKDLLHRKYLTDSSYWISKEPMKHTLDEARHQF